MNKSDILIIGFDKDGKDFSVMTVSRRIGDDLEIINVLTKDEADEAYSRLTNHKYFKIKNVVINVINECLGFKLHNWQISYIFGESSSMPTDRRNGKTTAYMLKLLLSEGAPIPIYNYDVLKSYCDECQGPTYYNHFLFELQNMYEKLEKTGLDLRKIQFSIREQY